MVIRNLPRANAENITSVIEESMKEFGGVTKANLDAKLVGLIELMAPVYWVAILELESVHGENSH